MNLSILYNITVRETKRGYIRMNLSILSNITQGDDGYKYKWDCCPNEYLFKLKQGHQRNSIDDLEVDEEGNLVFEHTTGCQHFNQHEE